MLANEPAYAFLRFWQMLFLNYFFTAFIDKCYNDTNCAIRSLQKSFVTMHP